MPRKLQIAAHVHDEEKLQGVAFKIKGILSTLNDVHWDDIEVAISCAPPDDEGEKADAIGFQVHNHEEEEDED